MTSNLYTETTLSTIKELIESQTEFRKHHKEFVDDDKYRRIRLTRQKLIDLLKIEDNASIKNIPYERCYKALIF